MGFEQMWQALAPIGRSARTGGYDRLPWGSAEAELRAWFTEAATARGLRVQDDGFGNVVGWWPGADRPTGRAEGVLTGSHLDSVADGGAYDGPLGVVSALAAIDLLRERGVTPARPFGVAIFAAEEGSRFGTACLGSRLATGALPWEKARELRDADGVALADLVSGEGTRLLEGVGRFVELHVEQGRALDVPVGQASGIWPHGRWRFDFRGEANHAGSTAMDHRHDPMLTYAMTALAANKQARVRGTRATFGRVAVQPNGTNAIPSQVLAWLDARAATDADLGAFLDELAAQASSRAERDGTELVVTAESVTAGVSFDPLPGLPAVPSQAGHDAGILADAGIATSMLFVRNPTGISHAPGESATLDDCLAGVRALADVLQGMLA